MKIALFDLQTAGHHLQYVKYLARYFDSMDDEVSFITYGPDEQISKLTEELSNIDVHFLNEKPKKNTHANTLFRDLEVAKLYRRAIKYAQNKDFNIFQILYLDRNEISFYISQFNVGKGLGIFGLLVGTYFLKEPLGSNLSRFYKGLKPKITRRLLETGKMEKLFVLSDKTRGIILDRWKGLDKRLVQTVPDPIEPFYNSGTKKASREKLDLPKDVPIFLFFGGLREEKGPDILLESALKTNEDLLVVIAGPGKDYDKDEIKAYENRSSKILTRIEFISDKDVKNYYLACDVVVLPYRKGYHGTSGILQHAAAAGRPVIATDVGHIGDITRENCLGEVIPPGSSEILSDTLDKFASGDVDLSENKKKSIQYAEEHHWENFAKEIRDSYLEFLE